MVTMTYYEIYSGIYQNNVELNVKKENYNKKQTNQTTLETTPAFQCLTYADRKLSLTFTH